ncbi:MAG: prepilin-type N-terminal cleavage/methylation domain-containing protein [Deltaproteobacteria bacterium]|nr:prepilin-type N-terminal cleavage/methylation domain-containing protein [Deltaproteobacteria bacterium]MBW2121536.1 prepilin-type N-terminal cleavage/methylation domain-containing protein [Deltaproteobacteria bacterium]
MRRMDCRYFGKPGFTLIELIVAMAVAGIVLAGAYEVFRAQQRTYMAQDQVAEMQQNARAAMNLLTKDLRMVGHGVPDQWPLQIGEETFSEMVVIDGRTLTLVGCFGSPASYLDASAARGDQKITVVDGSRFDSLDRRYLFVGEYDKVTVQRVEGNVLILDQKLAKRYPTTCLRKAARAGDTQIRVYDASNIWAEDILTLGDERLFVTKSDRATNTIVLNSPLYFEYPRGMRVNPVPVYRVQIVKYYLKDNGTLTRQDFWARGQVRELAEHIESLSVTKTDYGGYRVAITARTALPDAAGRLRRRTYCLTVKVRNRARPGG